MLPLAADYPLLNIIWTMLVFFGLFLWIMLIFRAFADLFGRHDVSGWGKAAWTILIILIPLIGVCIYLLTQGKGVAEREAAKAKQSQGEFNDYVKNVAGASPAEDIAKAKALLDSGAIDADEFNRLKAKALA
ncbi:MAG TPA: SHOCT domain-containing protein [Solirubrobacterales bacterium]|nr:SHOCT domain-containing protein [Solirubrobacterales bacterium]